MHKRSLLSILILLPFLLSAQTNSDSKIRSFQLGLGTGIGFNKWETPYPEGGKGEDVKGFSIVNSLDFTYRVNRLKIGVGLGFDYYDLNPYDGSTTTFFPKLTAQAEYVLGNGKFTNSPNFQLGVMWYELGEQSAYTLFTGLGWTFEYEFSQNWSIFIKPVFEYKWPKELVADGERIYSMYVMVGVRFRIGKR